MTITRIDVRARDQDGSLVAFVGRMNAEKHGFLVLPEIDARAFYRGLESYAFYHDVPLDPGEWTARHFVSLTEKGDVKAAIKLMVVGRYRTERKDKLSRFLLENLE